MGSRRDVVRGGENCGESGLVGWIQVSGCWCWCSCSCSTEPLRVADWITSAGRAVLELDRSAWLGWGACMHACLSIKAIPPSILASLLPSIHSLLTACPPSRLLTTRTHTPSCRLEPTLHPSTTVVVVPTTSQVHRIRVDTNLASRHNNQAISRAEQNRAEQNSTEHGRSSPRGAHRHRSHPSAQAQAQSSSTRG